MASMNDLIGRELVTRNSDEGEEPDKLRIEPFDDEKLIARAEESLPVFLYQDDLEALVNETHLHLVLVIR